MKKENLEILWLTILVAIFAAINLPFFDKEYTLIAVICLIVFAVSRKWPKWMYFTFYHTIVFGLIYYVIDFQIIPILSGWNWSVGGINLIGWFGTTLILIIYAAFLIGLILSISSCFTSTKVSEKQIAQLSYFGTNPEWGKNQRNGKFGLFLGMPPYMVKITTFSIESPTTDVKDESIQVHRKDGSHFSIVLDGKFQSRTVNTLKAMMNPHTSENLKSLYVSAATSWFACHTYENVEEAKRDRSGILYHIEYEMSQDALCQYGDEVTGVQVINLETPKVQREQQDKNDAALEKIAADEKAEMMSLENHSRKVNYMIERFKEITGETKITQEILKGIEDRVMTLDKTITRKDVKGDAKAFTRV